MRETNPVAVFDGLVVCASDREDRRFSVANSDFDYIHMLHMLLLRRYFHERNERHENTL